MTCSRRHDMQLQIPNPEELSHSELESVWAMCEGLNQESYNRYAVALSSYAPESKELQEARRERLEEIAQISSFKDYWRGVREALGYVNSFVDIRSLN